MSRIATVAAALLAAGCIGSRAREVPRYHVLQADAGRERAASATRPATLLVAPTTASTFYDAQEMAFSRSAGTLAYYQFNNWTEPPSLTINALLVSRLERSGAFRTVATATSGIRGSLVLATHLAELYHDAAEHPGVAHVSLSAELIDDDRRVLIARRTFSRSAPATSWDAPGAAKGFSAATGALLDDVVAWVDEVAPR